MTRTAGIVVGLLLSLFAPAQGGDQQLRAKADGLFDGKNYIEALPLYSQLVSLSPSDRVLNYRFGTCLLFGGTDKDKARIEAILVGVKSLMKVDKNGCRRFLESYVEAKESDKICDAAGGNDDETTRRLLKDNVPPRKSKK